MMQVVWNRKTWFAAEPESVFPDPYQFVPLGEGQPDV